MKSIDLSNAKELSTKYARLGLEISFELNRFGMILRGYWDILYPNNIEFFNKMFDYSYLEALPDDITLEVIVDEFKAEFENKLRERENLMKKSILSNIQKELEGKGVSE